MFYNPTVIVKYDVRNRVMSLFPQGWGFFTKSPLDPMVMIYRQEGEKNELLTYTNSSRENYWGLSKRSRAIGIEMSKVLPQIPDDAWIEKRGEFQFPKTLTDTIILKENLHFFPPGIYIFHHFKTVKFAWANQDQEKYKPYSTAKVLLLSQSK